MYKFFVNDDQIKDDIVKIVDSDVNHIVNVLRLNIDDNIQICNKDTADNYVVTIINFDKDFVEGRIVEKIKDTFETNINICLYQGIPKSDKMEFIIQKCVEIGVKRFIPISMERCIVKLDNKDKIKKIDRWQKISEVAAKQSKRDIIPKVENVINMQELISRIKSYDLFIVAYEEENDISLKEVLKNNKNVKNIGILIGPEGGIDKKEIELLCNIDNVKIVTLGKRILRTETAPIVIASNIIYELE